MVAALHAVNVLRESGAVVPVEEYRRVCDERDALRSEVARLTSILFERTPTLVTVDDLTIDTDTGRLWRNGELIGKLSEVERKLVSLFAIHQGRPVSYVAIDRAIWGGDGNHEGCRRVRVNLNRLRTKMGDHTTESYGGGVYRSRYFETYRDVGVALR
jgi:DNA-binding response OmpR family regulator